MGILYEACASKNEELESGACGMPLYGAVYCSKYWDTREGGHNATRIKFRTDIENGHFDAVSIFSTTPDFNEFAVTGSTFNSMTYQAKSKPLAFYRATPSTLSKSIIAAGTAYTFVDTGDYFDLLLPTDAAAGTFLDFNTKHKYWAMLGVSKTVWGVYCNGDNVTRAVSGANWNIGFASCANNVITLGRTMSILRANAYRVVAGTNTDGSVCAAVLERGNTLPLYGVGDTYNQERVPTLMVGD